MRANRPHPLKPSARLKSGGRKAITTAFKPGDKVSQLVRTKRSKCSRRHRKVAIVLYALGQLVLVRYKNRPKEAYPAWALTLAPKRTVIVPGVQA
ncbi:hypothetical protein NJH24_17170 [Pseudomonas asiatica]|uniref:hypothetical protein n=1 Tax=Pseudomonas asiatica TaxID=2219225 RepID=UPI00209B1FEB|nr:hypothetical protein [Pseudomonas asiatica]MCO7536509.1 hypothetical protein [Pseudomonas asiatica]MCO7550257.1 hypothetical protein [Pseudomonas asiatica]MCO7560616.1 hypothetical protein [Pseudomonas asiatica]